MSSSSSSSSDDDETDINVIIRSLHIPIEEIELATNNFADENLLKQTSNYMVYKGQILQSGELIDIVARRTHNSWKIINEVSLSNFFNHKNIASPLKVLITSDFEVIINKYEVNGTLKEHLSGPTLTWMQRLHICVGVARALKHLHYDAFDTAYLIHGRLNSSRILLDHNWEPKLAGLGYIFKCDKHHTHLDAPYLGSPEYMDPAYTETCTLNHKSDIFSFGVMLFEVLFSIEASIENNDKWYFAQLSRSHYENKTLDDLIDPDLRTQINLQSLEVFAKTAYYCLKETRTAHLDTSQVLLGLEKALKLQHKHEHPIATSTVEGISTSDRLKGKGLDHLKIPLRDIQLATNKFSKTYFIGSGTYGEVYKAQLNLDKINSLVEGMTLSTVAIKRIISRNDEQGEQGFLAEIEILSKCNHPNIVPLKGFCYEEGEAILVYEYELNGSLANHLRNIHSTKIFTWGERILLCIYIAHGLQYLHTSTHERNFIIHRDIKSANILLNDKWVAKISDFGLSRLQRETQQRSTVATGNIAGTEIYLDPEYLKTCTLKTQSDVFSFGVVMFELLCGKLAYDETFGEEGLPPIARKCFEEETINNLVDQKLIEVDESIFILVGGVDQDSLYTYTKVAYQCLAETQSERPTIEVIINELQKALDFQKRRNNKLLIPLQDILSGTENFNENNCIGKEKLWKLYEGKVRHANGFTTVFVKRWYHLGYSKFLNELQILLKYKHVNIIGLVGYYDDVNEHITVYEHAFNKKLDKHLDNHSLTWMKRLKICIDLASVLAFLHKGGGEHQSRVIHGCINSNCILLDYDWNAKVSNFDRSYQFDVLSKEGIRMEDYDIWSLCKVLIDMLCGRLESSKASMNNRYAVLEHLGYPHSDEHKKLDEMVFEGIKKQIDQNSLVAFESVIIQGLRSNIPSVSDVVVQLKKALKFQEDYEAWEPKLPVDYKEIIKMSKDLVINNSTTMKKVLYDMFSKGILLHDDKVLFSYGSNGERNEMISATMFSYKNLVEYSFICDPNSRFQKIAEMLMISKLKIQIRITPRYLSAGVKYGAFLILKFVAFRKRSSKPIYVNLMYKKGKDNFHAYFATWRDDEWMMIELWRFLSDKKEKTFFAVLLESLSKHHCGKRPVHVEGIEFRVIDNVKNEEVLKSNSDKDQLSLPKEVKHLMLSPMEVLYDSSNVKHFHPQPSAELRFQEVIELLPPQITFRINYKIPSQMLSQDTEYLCYLVFKLSEKCVGLHCPVRVRDLVSRDKKEAKFIYFRSQSPWNIHENNSVPEQREDGLMEVKVWKFHSRHQLKNDCIRVYLKFITYEGTMSGLIVCGLECRPV